MTKNIALSRPATSAIAAFLALSTPAAFAQEAPMIPMTPPVATPAPETAPTTPETGPATIAPPVVQSTQPAETQPLIRVPLDIAPTEPAPAEAEPAAPARAEGPARAERSARQAPAESTAAPAVASAAEPASVEPIAETVIAPAAALPSAASAEPVTAEGQPAEFPWELAGGAAALIALGGVGLALARRRRAQPGVAETAAPLASSMPTARTPDQPWVTPDYTAAPVRSTPAFAAAPSGSMGRHEAMAMAGPTPENPFLTLPKRLKRARFFDRKERLAYEQTLGAQKDMTRRPVSAWEIAQRESPTATQQQEVRRPEPARGRRDLRPGFSRS